MSSRNKAGRASDVSFEEEETAFLHELGHAISMWAAVENQLFYVLAKDMTRKQFEFLKHGYFSIRVFQEKLSFVNGLLTKSLKRKKDIERWQSLHKRLTRCSAQRNHLAHWPVVAFVAEDVGRRIGLTGWLAGARFTSKGPMAPLDALCLLDVARIRHSFLDLFWDLTDLAHDRKKRPRPFLGSLERDQPPTQVRTLIDQIRAKLGSQQPPSDP
jgi:hypothetical protein